jgi:hypothetical protein
MHSSINCRSFVIDAAARCVGWCFGVECHWYGAFRSAQLFWRWRQLLRRVIGTRCLLPFEDVEEREFAPDALSDETSTLLARRPCNRSRKRMPGILARPSNSCKASTIIYFLPGVPCGCLGCTWQSDALYSCDQSPLTQTFVIVDIWYMHINT